MSLPAGVDLCQFPALAPPAGHTPNFTHPSPSLEPALVTMIAIMTAFGVLFVSGRLYLNRRQLQLADYCAILALVFDVALSGILLAMRKYMRHQWDVPACWFNGEYMKYNFAVQFILPLSHSFSKATILLLFLHIFKIDRKMRIAIYGGLVFTALVYWPNLVLVPVFSVPYAGETWTDLVTSPRVQKMTTVGEEQGILAVVLDLYIFLLPFPVLRSLQVKSAKRLHLLFIFGFAFAGVVSSIVGLVYRVLNLHSEDHTWSTAQLYICIIVEVYVALIVACVPAFAAFLRVHVRGSGFFRSLTSFRQLMSSSSRRRQAQRNSGGSSDDDGSLGKKPQPQSGWKLAVLGAGKADQQRQHRTTRNDSLEQLPGYEEDETYHPHPHPQVVLAVPGDSRDHGHGHAGFSPLADRAGYGVPAAPGIAVTRTYAVEKTYYVGADDNV
ncbi:hypothetical protein F4780DRAFT_764799 [Xylariomycetidae sp. FL0641]|nr:hypothetical protein F4780DRAFT_764799 [Xylariomycetidae sp. FL0641]